MSFQEFVFYFLSAVLIVSAVAIITARNPVHAVLCMVLCFFTTAGLWLLLQAEFRGIVLVRVSVGAVMVLFLFVVMMLDINVARLRAGFWSYLPLGAFVALLLVAEMVIVLGGGSAWFYDAPSPPPLAAGYSDPKELGRVVYTEYVYPFEIAGVILLVAIVAAIALTLRGRKPSKYIDPVKQINVRRKDRVRIVSMPSEKQDQGSR